MYDSFRKLFYVAKWEREKWNLFSNSLSDGCKALKISVFIIMSYCTETFNSARLELGHRNQVNLSNIFLSFPPGFQNKNRVAILAELDKEKRKLLMQNQSSTNHPGARYFMFLDLFGHHWLHQRGKKNSKWAVNLHKHLSEVFSDYPQ